MINKFFNFLIKLLMTFFYLENQLQAYFIIIIIVIFIFFRNLNNFKYI